MKTITETYEKFKSTTMVENERVAFLYGATCMMDVFHFVMSQPGADLDDVVESVIKELEAAMGEIDLDKLTP